MTIEEVRSEITNKLEDMQRALDADDVEKAEAIKAEIAEYQEMIKQLEAELESVEGESQEQPAEPTEEKSEEEEAEEEREDKVENDTNVAKADEQKEEENNLNKEEKRNMTNIEQEVIIEEVVEGTVAEERSNFQNYILTGEIRDLTTDSGAVVVPEAISNQVENLTEDSVRLDKFVKVQKVNTKSGVHPVYIGDAIAPLQSVAELEENPKLAVQPISEKRFDVKTYRGYLPVSRESIEDGVGAEKLVKEILAEAVVNTRNAHILDALGEFEAVTAEDLDALKDIVNVDLKLRYKKQIIMSQSAFNTIDKMKDNNGQYLFQNSISSETGKRLFGLAVVILDDELIGENTMYVGDMSKAVVLFDRSQYSAQWTSYMHFAECLMVAIRHDVKVLDENAVIKVNLAPVAVPEA